MPPRTPSNGHSCLRSPMARRRHPWPATKQRAVMTCRTLPASRSARPTAGSSQAVRRLYWTAPRLIIFWSQRAARSGGKVNDAGGVSLFLVPRDAKGLTVTGYPTQTGARAADLTLDGLAASGGSLIGDAGSALPAIRRAVDRGMAALCAEAVGVMNALNSATLEYLKTRKQFGVAIGTFQA